MVMVGMPRRATSLMSCSCAGESGRKVRFLMKNVPSSRCRTLAMRGGSILSPSQNENVHLFTLTCRVM
ncbi:MAG: hypothetical protein IPI49_33550 [Myxococcales bacterium]|nr:hypothetical protein [Myxococcales bacterium]